MPNKYLMLALVSRKNDTSTKWIVKNDLLQGELEDDIYMLQPPRSKCKLNPCAIC